MEKILKVAIIGPESTGKSTLAAALAKHYHTIWVQEYAREYCSKLTTECTLQDEINMFYGQLALEEQELAQKPSLLICDTTILTVKVWCEHVFGSCPDFIKEEIATRAYDFYVLLDIDMPWEPDPLRDFPHLRAHFLTIYREELKLLAKPFTFISGLGEQRLNNAVAAIDTFLAKNR